MIYLVCYDIEHDRLRTQLAHKLQDWGLERIQKSVFVGKLSDAYRKKLEEWLQKNEKLNVKEQTFSVLVFNLAPNQMERVQQYGNVSPDWPYILGEIYTLIL